MIKYHITPGDNDSGFYEINFPYYGGGSSEEWRVWKDKVLKALVSQSISTGPLQYRFTERLLIGDAKATFNQSALDNGIRTIYNFNKVLLEMTKQAFPVYPSCEQKRYLHRHLVKPRSMKLHGLISRLQIIECLLRIVSAWYRWPRNCTSTCKWNYGHHILFHANHVER